MRLPFEPARGALSTSLHDYVHRMRNVLNVPIMRATLVRERAQELRARCVAVRMLARDVRARRLCRAG